MARPEDQTANLNRCLFFITLLISYATPSFYSEFRLPRVRIHYSDGCTSVYPSHIDSFPTAVRIRNGLSPLFSPFSDHPRPSFFTESIAPQFHLALFRGNAIRGCIESYRYTCTHAVLHIPAGPIHPWSILLEDTSVGRHTHTQQHTHTWMHP